ncbi:MAG: hypothetical protein AAGF66_01115 [Cyanobacteria bacterium P01_H01_bin.119]
MLVMLTQEQLLSPQVVCQGCLMADSTGQPRWRHGQLRCGRPIGSPGQGQSQHYECQMGFRVTNIEITELKVTST